MSLWNQTTGFRRFGLVAVVAMSLCGCLPPGADPADEQKEPHFLAGKTRVNSLDFHGAIESFEKALEVNPRSASAHFELGWLFNEKEPDPAAAIYHYEKYLKLRPNADNAELVRQRVNACKLDLAKAVLPLPVTPTMELRFQQLAEENKQLKDEVAKWQAYAASQPRAPTTTGTPVMVMTRPSPAGETMSPTPAGGATAVDPAASRSPNVTQPPASLRTHKVKAGDSPYSIAKQYGVKLDALLAANPGLKQNPKRLQVGQTVNIPAR